MPPRGANPHLPEAQHLIGRTVGGVRLERVLQGSGRARVFQGTQEPIGRPVVLKLLPALDTDPTRREAQLREVQILSQLRHPNIVTLYNVGVFDNIYPYFVTEFIQGGTLRDLMDREGPQPPARTLGILAQLSSALEELHRLGGVHRQLTPENILLEELVGSRQELVKVSGFSLAGAPNHDESSLRLETLASPRYATPEQVLGADLTEASDLYACGVLFFELLTGRLPYEHTDPPRLWDDIVRGATPRLAQGRPALGAHVPLQQLGQRLLAKQPADRLASARTLRLLASRLREDLIALSPDEAGYSQDQFPVLMTAARLKSVAPTPWRDPDPPTPPLPVDLDLPQETTADDLDDLFTAAPGVVSHPDTTTVSLDRAELSGLTWLTPFPQRTARAAGEDYVLLGAASARGERLTWRIADGAELLQETTLRDGTRIFALALPIYPERWLARLAQRARLDAFTVGLAGARGFPGEGGAPDLEALTLAAFAARVAQSGQILTHPDTARALRLDAWFEPTGLSGALELVRFQPR